MFQPTVFLTWSLKFMLCFASLSKLSMHNFLFYVIIRAGNIVDLSNSVRGFRLVLWIRPFFIGSGSDFSRLLDTVNYFFVLFLSRLLVHFEFPLKYGKLTNFTILSINQGQIQTRLFVRLHIILQVRVQPDLDPQKINADPQPWFSIL